MLSSSSSLLSRQGYDSIPSDGQKASSSKSKSTLKMFAALIAAIALVSLAGTLAYKHPYAHSNPSDVVSTDAVSRVQITADAGTVVTLSKPQYPSGSLSYENDWDKPLEVTRVGALCQLRSEHSNYFEDRKFGFGHCKPATAGKWGPINLLAETGWDATYTRVCPSNQFMVGVSSYHSNYYEDRRSKYKCAEFGVDVSTTKYVQANCVWDGQWFNKWDGYFVKTCPANMVLAGITSTHSNYYEDRLFKFYCCNMAAVSGPSPPPPTPPSKPQPSCQTYANPTGVVVKGKKIFATDVTTDMDVAFKVTLLKTSPVWLNLLHVGDGNFERSPSVWVYASNVQALAFTFNGGQPNFNQQAFSRLMVNLNQEYTIQMKIRGLEAQIFVNNQLRIKMLLGSEDRKIRTNVPVYASNPWYGPATALLKGLAICPFKVTTTKPPPLPKCLEYPNDAKNMITRSKFLFPTKTTPQMEIVMKLRIDAFSAGWNSVFHIGNTPQQRGPGIWTYAGYQKKLHISFNGPTNSNQYQQVVNVDIEGGTLYELRINLDGLKARVMLNGQVKGELTLTSANRFYVDKVPVFAGNPWNYAARGVVYGLKVCTFE